MTTQKRIKSDAAVITVCQSRIKGIQTYAPTTGTIACSGTPYTAAALTAIYQKAIDTRLTLETLRHQTEVAIQARDAADASRKAVDAGLIQWAVNTFGPDSQEAKDLGYLPRNPTPPTAATLAEAVVKSKATRVARGTRGKLQKKGITGATAAVGSASTAAPGAPAAGAGTSTTAPVATPVTAPVVKS
jgi:hypothetical protein